MHLFFSVGEPSGDQHAAHLIQELRRRDPNFRATGFGGPAMEQAGCATLFRLTNMAVMGVFAVIPLIWKFYKLVQEAGRAFERDRPDAVVLVDFPGFNWWIAHKAKKAGIPVIYYLPPQLWAWASWRIRKVRRYVDHVLSALEFETEWYAARGIPVTYVGHPFFDEVSSHPLDRDFCEEWRQPDRRIVALLPGSRTHEVTQNWPVLLETARRLAAKHSDLTFLVANYKNSHRDWCADEYVKQGAGLPLTFYTGKTAEIIDVAECALMVSGSVSLEMLARRTPAVVVYRVGWPTYLIGRALVNIQSMTLPNLMSGKTIYPEYLSVGDPEPTISRMFADVDRWLTHESALNAVHREIDELRRNAFQAGATKQVATFLQDRFGRPALAKAA